MVNHYDQLTTSEENADKTPADTPDDGSRELSKYSKYKILIVEANPVRTDGIREVLIRNGFNPKKIKAANRFTESLDCFAEMISNGGLDLIIHNCFFFDRGSGKLIACNFLKGLILSFLKYKYLDPLHDEDDDDLEAVLSSNNDKLIGIFNNCTHWLLRAFYRDGIYLRSFLQKADRITNFGEKLKDVKLVMYSDGGTPEVEIILKEKEYSDEDKRTIRKVLKYIDKMKEKKIIILMDTITPSHEIIVSDIMLYYNLEDQQKAQLCPVT